MSYHQSKEVLVATIRGFFYSLRPQTYDELAPKIEYWIEYVISEQFTTPKGLAEEISLIAWHCEDLNLEAPRFLKEFRDAPHRPEQMRSFVDGLCLRILRWFAGASADIFGMDDRSGLVPSGGGNGFVRAASFLGGLIKYGLVGRQLVQWHVVKPLTLYNKHRSHLDNCIRASAIYKLFATAGDTLLQGLLDPRDAQACFEILDTQISSSSSQIVGFDKARFEELREIHTTWLQSKEEKEQGEEKTAGPPGGDADTPVPFAPQDLPDTDAIDSDDSPSAPQSIDPLSVLRDLGFSPNPFIHTRISTAPSPTLSVSTLSDLTPIELVEDIGEGSGEQALTRHETFYLEDGNVEVLCGHTIFRVHSPIVSFSSSKFRDMLSKSTLLNAPTPEGCPRVVFMDSAEDFAVLLKMIYTPGFPTWGRIPEFSVFASLLRMATKYGYSDVRGQLVRSLEGAYPARWDAYQAAKVLGEDAFGSPKPHPNAVLNLFLEQKVGFALPLAAYRAAVCGFTSLITDKPGMTLPRLTLASAVYGMEAMRIGVSKLAYSIVCAMGLKECYNRGCLLSGNINSLEQGMEGLHNIYNTIVKEGRSDVLSRLSLGEVFCESCAKNVEKDYDSWCAVIWETLPLIFRVGNSWEELVGNSA